MVTENPFLDFLLIGISGSVGVGRGGFYHGVHGRAKVSYDKSN